MDLGQHPQISDQRGWVGTLLIQSICALWILPIVALQILNIRGHIIGASVWCPDQNCYVGWFDTIRSVVMSRLRTYDRRDHNVLGSLQFAAKGLEIWFELIAMGLVYLLTFLVARKMDDGLPIGFLTRPNEFADVPGLFDPLFWRTLPPIFKRNARPGCLRYRLRVYLFIGFTVFLCVLCNLMGPATAVLLIPSLQWADTPPIGDRTFVSINSESPPKSTKESYLWQFTPNCTEEHFANLSFSCAAEPYAAKLDSWLGSYIASGYSVDGQTSERAVKFRLNATFSSSSSLSEDYSDITYWAPSREMMTALDVDLSWLASVSWGYSEQELKQAHETFNGYPFSDRPETYYLYNRSLQLNIQRSGPVFGAIVQTHFDYNDTASWTVEVDEHRLVRCYGNYDLGNSSVTTNTSLGVYTKCVRIGGGWSPLNKQYGFTLLGERDYITDDISSNVQVSIFTSDMAKFFKHGEVPPCLQAGQAPAGSECDWDMLFSVDSGSNLFNRTRNVTTIEMATEATDPNFKLTVDFVAFLNFTTYQMDPSPLTNPAMLAQFLSLPRSGQSIHVDPAWLLAAWTVNNNSTVSPNRTSTMEVVRMLNGLRLGLPEADPMGYRVAYISLVPVVQALSLIDFTTEIAASGVTSENALPDHPLLTRNAKMYVWAYGLSSRTSKLGLVVVSLGIAVVLVQLVLGFIDRRKYRSATQLLVAALEHAPANEFQGIEHDETKVARTRFHVQGTINTAGKYTFRQLVGRA